MINFSQDEENGAEEVESEEDSGIQSKEEVPRSQQPAKGSTPAVAAGKSNGEAFVEEEDERQRKRSSGDRGRRKVGGCCWICKGVWSLCHVYEGEVRACFTSADAFLAMQLLPGCKLSSKFPLDCCALCPCFMCMSTVVHLCPCPVCPFFWCRLSISRPIFVHPAQFRLEALLHRLAFHHHSGLGCNF